MLLVLQQISQVWRQQSLHPAPAFLRFSYESMCSTASRGPWLRQDNSPTPAGAETLKDLQKHSHIYQTVDKDVIKKNPNLILLGKGTPR